jgi:vacuolar-type H+-ATPase subunit C/Vma6
MLLGNLINTGKQILDYSPKQAKFLFSSLTLKYTLELIELIMDRFGEVEREKMHEMCSIYHPLLSSETEKCLKICIDTAEEKGDILNTLNELNPRVLCGFHLEEITPDDVAASLLNRCYFLKLWSSIDTLSRKDAVYARRLIGTEIEVINILTLFRSAVHGYDASRFIIPVNYRIGDIINSLHGASLQGIVSALSDTPYGEAVSDGFRCYEESNSLLKLEMNLKKQLLREHKRVFWGYPFHIGILLGFLKLKEYEVRNLITILVGIKYDLSVEERGCLLIT